MIYIYNAHNELWFGINFKTWIYRRPWRPKYKYMTDGILKNQRNFLILCKPFYSQNFYRRLLFLLSEYLNIKIWALINGINPFKVRCVFNPEKICNNDILLILYIGNFTTYEGAVDSQGLVNYLNRSSGIAVLNINHYPYHIDTGSFAVKNLKFKYFWAEANLKNNDFFQKYFKNFKQSFIVTPFAVRDIFLCTQDFDCRKDAAVAVGTLSAKMDHDSAYINYFNSGILQPIRNDIYNNDSVNENNNIFSYISDINEGGESRPVRAAKNLFIAISNWLHNIFIFGQKKYNKLNMCELFNKYKLHIVGEEIVGLPGIGFAEGMMCGSVFVGIDHPMYRDIGMIPGVHYIGYDGGYDELVLAINSVLNDGVRLKLISRNSLNFAENNFKPENIFNNFVKKIH